jgi:hypothetical protein
MKFPKAAAAVCFTLLFSPSAFAQNSNSVLKAAELALAMHNDVDKKLNAAIARLEPEARARGYDIPKWRTDMSGNLRRLSERGVSDLSGISRLEDVINLIVGGQSARDVAHGSAGADTPKALGAVDGELVYTPIVPCRLVDTRGAGGGGPFTVFGQVRSFYVSDRLGVASNVSCLDGKTFEGFSEPAALHVTLTAIPTTFGNLEIRPYGGSATSSSVNFTGAAGESLANSLTIPMCRSCGPDFEIAVQQGPGQVNFIVDVLGFYSAPKATPLSCVETAQTVQSLAAAATGNATAPACATGYTSTSTNCEADSWLAPFVYVRNGTCSAQNNGVATTIRASQTCCRVPGF